MNDLFLGIDLAVTGCFFTLFLFTLVLKLAIKRAGGYDYYEQIFLDIALVVLGIAVAFFFALGAAI